MKSSQNLTIIMMFGDHQPADYITNVVDTGKKTGSNDAFVTSIGTGSDRKERYIVPFVMWANYDINEKFRGKRQVPTIWLYVF